MTRASTGRWNASKLAAALLLPLLSACGGETPPPAPEIAIGTKEGLRAPELRGIRADSSTFVAGFAEGRPSVLVFYRSADCGLCRAQLLDLQRNFSAYSDENAEVLGITLDPPQRNVTLEEDLALPFDLISVDTATFRAWGALSDSSGAPLPATYVVDPHGIVRFRQVGRNAGDRASDADVVTVLHRIPQP